MPVSLQSVKQEIADRASTIDGLRCYSEAPPSPQPPALGVRGPIRWSYGIDFDADWSVALAVDLFVNPNDLVRAQQALDSFIAPLGPKSVKYALEHVEVTPNIIESVRVVGGNQPYAFYGDESSTRLLVATLEVQVYPSVDDPAPLPVPAPLLRYPQDVPFASVTQPTLARPDYLVAETEPSFGTTLMRISDKTAFGTTSDTPRHIYAKMCPWSSDDDLLLLSFDFPCYLLDGTTLQFLRLCNAPSQQVWGNTLANARALFGVSGNGIVKMTVDPTGSDSTVTLATLSSYSGVDHGGGEGNLSNDDRYMALAGAHSGTLDTLLVFDLVNLTVVASAPFPVGANYNNCGMSQDGNWLVVGWNDSGASRGQGVEVFDCATMTFQRQVSQRGGTHYDLGVDTNGRQVWVGISDMDSSLVSVRLDNGDRMTHLPASALSYNEHFSCRNSNRPGWAYFTQFEPDQGKPDYHRLFAVKLDGSGLVENFSHTWTAADPTSAYDHAPMGVPNRDGTKVLFASDWGILAAPVYSYLVQML